jgi:hypothetical protein
MRRAVAAGLLAALFLICSASSAAAIDIPGVPGPGDVVGKILDQLCDRKGAPTPQPPMNPAPAAPNVPEAQQGPMARYGYAGLYWTTYDQSCLSFTRIDNQGGRGLNDTANQLDTMINQLQALALSPVVTRPFDSTLSTAATGMGRYIWTPWLGVSFAALGLVVIGGVLLNRSTGLMTVLLNAVIVLAAVSLVTQHPGQIARGADHLTTATSGAVAQSLVASGGGRAPAAATIPEGYYRISYQAWLDGAFCGDKTVERVYGPRLRDAQAFTVAEYAAVKGDPAAQHALVQDKQDAWRKIAAELQTKHPVAFGCWTGETSPRTGAGIQHLVVTVFTGVFIAIAAIALIVLRLLTRFALLLIVGLGVVALVSRQVTAALWNITLTAVLGGPIVAGFCGFLLWGYYAILSDPRAAWWTSIVSAACLGLCVVVGWKFLRPIFSAGANTVERVSHRGRSATNAAITKLSSSGGPVTMAAGAAAGAAVAHHHDQQRPDPPPHQPDTPATVVPEKEYEPAMSAPSNGNGSNGHEAPVPPMSPPPIEKDRPEGTVDPAVAVKAGSETMEHFRQRRE